MQKLSSTTRWTQRKPSISSDAWWRTSLVLAVLFEAHTDEDSTDWPATSSPVPTPLPTPQYDGPTTAPSTC
ncbi:hypothetical protein M3148_02685 [Georgenia satyanarayanai]|uniref:hypothetical protein n=1 Tax=Georgenia satyanarayanai TaxID=860221 RepID=UPI00203E014C|nr:hypothetical protein [Georgenia satyanarayanai]MCM3659905.1 hypothetical protein [Georgenia satyanarayanai]